MERLEIIEALKHFPEKVEAEIAGLSEATIAYKPSAEEWSIKEVVGHLRFADQIWYKRLYMVWSLTDPVLISFAGEDEALDEARHATDLRPWIAALRASRPRIIDLLSHAVDWSRVGQWPGEGRRSFKQLAEYLVSHDEDHLAQVQSLKEAAEGAQATA